MAGGGGGAAAAAAPAPAAAAAPKPKAPQIPKAPAPAGGGGGGGGGVPRAQAAKAVPLALLPRLAGLVAAAGRKGIDALVLEYEALSASDAAATGRPAVPVPKRVVIAAIEALGEKVRVEGGGLAPEWRLKPSRAVSVQLREGM